MNEKGNRPSNYLTMPKNVLHKWIPVAFGVFIFGNMFSILVMTTGRTLRMEDAIMSDLLSPLNNPHGYLIAVVATVICGLLLLPTATIFQNGWIKPYQKWAVLGAWLYRIGLVIVIIVGITTPFQLPYVTMHIWLTYAAFISIVGGLVVGLSVALYSSTLYRLPLASMLVLLIIVLLFVVYVFLTPDFFNGRRWFLALCEWLLNACIAGGVLTVTLVKVKLDN